MIEPRIFETFPTTLGVICPVCKTNLPGKTVLVQIDDTARNGVAEGKPVHLNCAIANQYNAEIGLLYRRT